MVDIQKLNIFANTVISMEKSQIDSIGNQRWLDWHQRLQKLNKQAKIEDSSTEKELVTKNAIISSGKVPILVYEAICIHVWRTKIYPQIVEMDLAPEKASCVYMVLLHEKTAVSLLESILSEDVDMQCIRDVVMDLLNYVVEQLYLLLDLINNGYLKPVTANAWECESAIEKLERQRRDNQFNIGMKCIHLIYYIVDHVEQVSASTSIFKHVYKTHDVPTLLARLLINEPWMKRTDKNEMQMYNFGRWKKPLAEDLSRMHCTEAQLWLCLRGLMLEQTLARYYTITEHRREFLCRLLRSQALEQIPPLADLKMFLRQLSSGDHWTSLHGTEGGENSVCKSAGSCLIVPQVQIKDAYLKQIHKRAIILAKVQLETFPSLPKVPKKAIMKCAKCGQKATQKCSKCKIEWYCGRECQVQQWPKHKDNCEASILLRSMHLFSAQLASPLPCCPFYRPFTASYRNTTQPKDCCSLVTLDRDALD